jgi:hypothetical protein
MHKISLLVWSAVFCLLAAVNVFAVETGHRVVIYDNLATEVAAPPTTFGVTDPGVLWVTLYST